MKINLYVLISVPGRENRASSLAKIIQDDDVCDDNDQNQNCWRCTSSGCIRGCPVLAMSARGVLILLPPCFLQHQQSRAYEESRAP